MRLSDIVGSLDLSIYTQVAMLLFGGVFIAVLWRTFGPRHREELNRAALLPLADEHQSSGERAQIN